MESLKMLKEQLEKIYKMQGFQKMVKDQEMWQLRDKTSVPPGKVDFESLINKVSTKPQQTE